MDSSSDIMNMEEGANANNLFSPRVPVDYSKVRKIQPWLYISQSPKLWHHEAI